MPALQYGSIPAERLGGAIVKRPFSLDGERLAQGADLDRGVLLSRFRPANLRALVETHYLDPYPLVRGAASEGQSAPSRGPVERAKIHLGRGQYKVIEGVFLTPGLVDAEEAERIANGGEPTGAASTAA